jgi:butyrate kinase
MMYQIKKTIGAMAAVLDFQPDGIILTGGMAQSPKVVATLTAGCAALAPMHIYPGSHESEALASGVARVMSGAEQAMTWPIGDRKLNK